MDENGGSFGQIATGDLGVQYGFGLFETFHVDKSGCVFLLDKHIARMLDSANYFGIVHTESSDSLIKKTKSFISANNVFNVLLKISMTAGNKSLNISPQTFFSVRENLYTREKIDAGCRLTLSETRKSEKSVIIRHKTSNYLENYLALKRAEEEGFDDAIFLNSSGDITETTKSNIFFIKNSCIHTPEVSCGLLPGIIRGWVIDKANKLEISTRQGCYKPDDILNADEVFVTNSAFGIMRVSAFNCGGNIEMKGNDEFIRLLTEELINDGFDNR